MPSAAELAEELALEPFYLSLFDNNAYYLHASLQMAGQNSVVFPFNDMNLETVSAAFEAQLQRAAPGFLKTLALWSPSEEAQPNQFGQMQPSLFSIQGLRAQLEQEYRVEDVDLTGALASHIDALLLVAPQDLSDEQRQHVDQFLMRGGSLVVAAGQYKISPDPFTGSLAVAPVEGGVNDLLAHYGVSAEPSLVLDKRNAPFPVVTERVQAGFRVQEVQAVDYPYFVAVGRDAMETDSVITAGLPEALLHFVSPLSVTKGLGEDLRILMRSSPQSWHSTARDIQPNFELYPQLGFPGPTTSSSSTLAVSVSSSFNSFFAGQAEGDEANDAAYASPENFSTEAPEASDLAPLLERSPLGTRLVVIGSSEFLNDLALNLGRQLGQDRAANNILFMKNVIDWALEDEELLAIRRGGASSRLLVPLETAQQRSWEAFNYVFALVAVLAFMLFWHLFRKNSGQRLSQRLTHLLQEDGNA